MAQYRKKPVVIDAWLFDGSWESAKPIVQLSRYISWTDHAGGELMIDTLEGSLRASAGDWIIKGIAGEFYPCKPAIFAETYDAVIP